jgi:2-iminobutanoate/2-iminopropanoate deaminase
MKISYVTTKEAPAAIGTYSQATIHKDLLYISGQIPLDPNTMKIIAGDFQAQIKQVFNNIKMIATAANTSLANCIKINIYLSDLENFKDVNKVMEQLFDAPYPARAVIEVSRLPRDVEVEIDAIVALEE